MTVKTAFLNRAQPHRPSAPRNAAPRAGEGVSGPSAQGARPTLVLASASPRRLMLLSQVGVEPDALRPSSIDESARRGEMPRAYAARIARAKAETARDQIANDKDIASAYVLAADTVVAVGRRILMKPSNIEEAAQLPAAAVGSRASRADQRLPHHARRPRAPQDRRHARALQASVARGDRGLYRLAGVARQSRRLRHSGPRRLLRAEDRRLLLERRRPAAHRGGDDAGRRRLSRSTSPGCGPPSSTPRRTARHDGQQEQQQASAPPAAVPSAAESRGGLPAVLLGALSRRRPGALAGRRLCDRRRRRSTADEDGEDAAARARRKMCVRPAPTTTKIDQFRQRQPIPAAAPGGPGQGAARLSITAELWRGVTAEAKSPGSSVGRARD